ncbi:MAG: histidinol-phosphate transaminase [Propionibacteriaceae bacterium]|jgi:histidinol-phosphate aminotransferase|nr:histidinol-phosphate transaminase [Propionibacteriaceae bacterium]
MSPSNWSGLPVRPELLDAQPYGAPQLDVPVRLNVNENPYPPPAAARRDMVAAAERAVMEINRYPDREAIDLRTKLARYLGHGLGPDHVWAANGSNEIMIQILEAFGGPGRSVMSFTPSYSMYPEYARDTHTEYLVVPRRADFTIDATAALTAIDRRQPHVIVIATPNNPTGTVTDLDVIAAIADHSDGVVVVDEAYQEFASGPSALTLLPDHGNVLVSRTMSKAFAFAGGRLGYVAAAPAAIDALRVVRLPYHLNAVTQAVAGAALDHADEMLAQVAHMSLVRDAASAALRSLELTVIDSQSNFFLFGPFADRHAVWQALLDRGVLVRETGPEPYLRVCVGTDEEMGKFEIALAQVLRKNDGVDDNERWTA